MSYIGNDNITQGFIPAVDFFSGNGSTTAFTLSRPVASVAQVQANISNVPQNPGSAYTVSGNTITFTSAPPSGTNNIYVYYTSPITQVIAPGQGTVNTTSLGNITNIASGNSNLTLQTGTTPTTAMTVDTSQNVGIGTASPAFALEVKRTGAISQISATSDTTAAYSYAKYNSGATNVVTGIISDSTTGYISVETNNPLVMRTNGTERMRIATTGNVGIGGTPSADTTYKWLNIIGPSTSGGGIVQLNNSDSSVGINMFCNNLAGYMGTSTAHPLLFRINSSEVARIDSSGNLLVGTTSATAKIAVLGASTTSANIALYAGDSNGVDLFYARCDGLINTGSRTLSPYNNTTGAAANMYVGATGNLSRSTSSLKYKKNVQDATHGLTELLTLRPVTYEGKAESDAGKTFGGLIAEEVHEAGLTEFVQYAEDGSPDALAYGNMVSLCIKAIQEQQALIQTLTDRITALENK